MNKRKKQPIELNTLEKLAEEYSQQILTPEQRKDIEQTDITNELYEDIEHMVTSKPPELVNIQIIGKVIKGKSTVNHAINYEINTLQKNKMHIKYIAADQIEFSRKVQDMEIHDCCIGIDEYNELSKGGYNATTEQQYLDQFSDIQAQRNIHRISCAPQEIIDKNAEIILQVINKDTKKKYTRCKVYYRVRNTTGYLDQIVGHADIYVGHILNKKWYKEYKKRKQKKWDLINNYAQRDLRDLEYAELVLDVYQRLKKLVGGIRITESIIENYIDIVKRKQKRFLGILTTGDLVRKVKGTISFTENILKTKREIDELQRKVGKRRTPLIIEIIQQKKEALQELQRGEQENLQEWQQLIHFKEEYMQGTK